MKNHISSPTFCQHALFEEEKSTRSTVTTRWIVLSGVLLGCTISLLAQSFFAH
jgi:hypothetical protein